MTRPWTSTIGRRKPRRSRQARGCVVALAIAFLALAPGASLAQSPEPVAAPDPSAPFFNDTVLHEIRLRINSDDWQTLIDNYGRNDYYPADMVWNGQVVRNLGIRSRGGGSRNPNKPGLRVDFNRYSSSQEFLGLTSFVLDNVYQDFAYMRELLSMKLFRRMGLAAPREAFTKLYVNEQYMGVYVIVESIDKPFLKRSPGLDPDGYLYEYKWIDRWVFNYLGPELDAYEPRFDPKTHEKGPYSTLYGPIEAFFRTVTEPNDIARDLGEILDVPKFLRHLAVEAYVAEWDGIVGDFGANNFYFYWPPNGGQFRFLPWDKDNAFKAKDYPIWPDGMNDNVLTNQLMQVGEFRDVFLQTLLECADNADARDGEPTEDGQPSAPWLLREIDAQYRLIADAAWADDKVLVPGVFDASIETLREFARERSGFVRASVGARRGEPSPAAPERQR